MSICWAATKNWATRSSGESVSMRIAEIGYRSLCIHPEIQFAGLVPVDQCILGALFW